MTTGEKLRQAGHEFGSTTGRPRRCGWFDALVARYAVRVNGLSGIALTKLDVLSGFETIKICTGYSYNGKHAGRDPGEPGGHSRNASPVYEEMPGWQTDITAAKTFADLPENAQKYVKTAGAADRAARSCWSRSARAGTRPSF